MSADAPERSPLLACAPLVAFVSGSLMLIGWHWDISWHRTIGRDTVWTLPHLLVYAALLSAFAYDLALVLAFTFGRLREAPAVTVFRFRGPSGAFVSLWGLAIQGAAILFDLWWHESYGLDLQVFSPPHYAIMIGTFPFYLGHFLLVARHANARGDAQAGRWLVVGFGSLCVATQLVGLDPVYGPAAYTSTALLLSTCLGVPLVLSLLDSLTGSRWAAPLAAALYASILIAIMQVFQLFRGEPHFGPVHHVPERFLPPAFPLAIVVPALAVALLWPAVTARFPRGLASAAAVGAVFALALAAAGRAQAEVLASELGRNRFFAGDLPPSAFSEGFRGAATLGADARSLVALAVAAAVAGAGALLGHRAGAWLRGLRR